MTRNFNIIVKDIQRFSMKNTAKKRLDFHKNYLGVKNAHKHSKQGQRKQF